MNSYRVTHVVDKMAAAFRHELATKGADPSFILAGAVPDYSHRLPDEYFCCVNLGHHGGVDVVLYSPRAFDVAPDGELTLYDGTLSNSRFSGEAEFSVNISPKNIEYSAIIHGPGYTGPPLHKTPLTSELQ